VSRAPPLSKALLAVNETDSEICMFAPSPTNKAPPIPPALPEKEHEPAVEVGVCKSMASDMGACACMRDDGLCVCVTILA